MSRETVFLTASGNNLVERFQFKIIASQGTIFEWNVP